MFPCVGRGLCGFNIPLVAKEGAPRLLDPLTQMWGRREKERGEAYKLSAAKHQTIESQYFVS